MRGKSFSNELGCEVFACVYWDSISKECLIYKDRPLVCRGFDCNDNQRGAYVRAMWGLLKEGMKMDCLYM